MNVALSLPKGLKTFLTFGCGPESWFAGWYLDSLIPAKPQFP